MKLGDTNNVYLCSIGSVYLKINASLKKNLGGRCAPVCVIHYKLNDMVSLKLKTIMHPIHISISKK